MNFNFLETVTEQIVLQNKNLLNLYEAQRRDFLLIIRCNFGKTSNKVSLSLFLQLIQNKKLFKQARELKCNKRRESERINKSLI